MSHNDPRLVANASKSLSTPIPRRSLLQYMGLAGAVTLGAGPLLTACSSGATGGTSADPAKMTKWAVGSSAGDIFMLDQVNFVNADYEKHGLDVQELIHPQSGVQTLQLLVAEGIDSTPVDTMTAISTFAKSTKGRRPMFIGVRAPEATYAVVTGPNGDWPDADASFEEKMAALKGKSIGVTAIGAGADLQLRLALNEAGMSYDDVTALAVGLPPQMIPNLKEGRVDAVISVQWSATRYIAQESGSDIYFEFADESSPASLREQAALSLVTRENVIEETPELIDAWIAAQNDGHQWILNNKDDAAELLNDYAMGGNAPDIAREFIDHYENVLTPKMQPDFKAPRDLLENMIGLTESFGLIDEGSVTYEDMVPEAYRA